MQNPDRKAKLNPKDVKKYGFKCMDCGDKGTCIKAYLHKPCNICKGKIIQTK